MAREDYQLDTRERGGVRAIHDSRLGEFLLLLLFVHNHHIQSHILYPLYLFLCCYLVAGGILEETIGLFDLPVLLLLTSLPVSHLRRRHTRGYRIAVVIAFC